MTRVLVLVIAVLVFFWLLRRALAARKPKAPPGPRAEAKAPELVACAQCGVHLPRSEALAGPDGAARYYCTADHLRLGPR
jgi:uncharacterized protein